MTEGPEIAEALTQQHLDQLNCTGKDCDHKNDNELTIGSACHETDITAVYSKLLGYLTLRCAECDQFIINIRVAEQ